MGALAYAPWTETGPERREPLESVAGHPTRPVAIDQLDQVDDLTRQAYRQKVDWSSVRVISEDCEITPVAEVS